MAGFATQATANATADGRVVDRTLETMFGTLALFPDYLPGPPSTRRAGVGARGPEIWPARLDRRRPHCELDGFRVDRRSPECRQGPAAQTSAVSTAAQCRASSTNPRQPAA